MTYAEFEKQAALLDVGIDTDPDKPMKVEVDKEIPVGIEKEINVRLRQPIDINLIPSQITPENAALIGALGGGTLGYLFGPEKKLPKLIATLATAGAGGLGGYYGAKLLRKSASIGFLNKLAAVRPFQVDKVLDRQEKKERKRTVKASPTLIQMIRQFSAPDVNPGIRYTRSGLEGLTQEELEDLYMRDMAVAALQERAVSAGTNDSTSN
jgi:hypothetical protein